MSKIIRLAIAALLAVPLATNAHAQDEASTTFVNGQKVGAWTVACRAVAVGETDCTLTQRILRVTDNAFVADIIATQNDANATFLIARVPAGAFLPNQFAMRNEQDLEAEDVMAFAWQTCSGQFCEAVIEVAADDVAALSADNNKMVAAFRPNAEMEPFVFQMSLAGLKDGLDAIHH